MNPLPHLSQRPDSSRLAKGLRTRLEAIFDAIAIESPTTFRFAGNAMPLAGAAGLGTGAALADLMIPAVYEHAYAQPFRGRPATPPPAAAFQPDEAFVASLSAAHHGQERRDPGWRIYKLGQNGAVHVQKGDLHRLALAGEYTFSGGPGRVAGVGDTVELLVVRESRLLQPGFFFVFGEALSSEFDDADTARLYFHAKPSAVPWLIETISGDLDRYGVPFRLKCLTLPAAYARVDSVVLYLARRFLGVALRLLAAHTPALGERLEPDVPLFAKELLPGLGAADEPGTGESFGQSRCRLVCQGIVDAWQQGLQTREARLEAVAGRFASLGLSLERPHLGEGMEDPYEWPAEGRAEA